MTANPHTPVLTVDVDHRTRHITLSHLTPDGVDHLGTFPTVAEAWTAIDALDCAGH